MSSSSVKAKEFALVQRKLENLCAIIEKMFNIWPRPNASLKQHLVQLEEAMSVLPAIRGSARLLKAYRRKAIHFGQILEREEGYLFGGTMLTPYGANGNPSFAYQSSRLPYKKPGGWLPSAEMVRSKLKAAFAGLDQVRNLEEDFEAMKSLLVLVTKARALTMPYWKNVLLLSDIFTYAFEKLPPLQQQLYQKEYNGEKKWLRDLRLFIQAEIDLAVSLKEETRALTDRKGTLNCGGDGASGAFSSGKKRPKKGMSVCFYCKLPNHFAVHCPILVSTLCVKCFKFGHTDWKCNNDMVFIRLSDI